MKTELVTIAPLPVPVPTNPTPALPAWFAAMTDALSIRQQPNETGKWTDMTTLPAAMLPTESQRAALEIHREQSVAILELTPTNDTGSARQMIALVGKLVLAKPARANGLEAEARIEAYTVALDDVPVWAVDAAIRKWHRGQCDRSFNCRGGRVEYDYRWAPESADLRTIALREACVPHTETSPDEQKRNQEAVRGIIADALAGGALKLIDQVDD
jgi:hypothetical protein